MAGAAEKHGVQIRYGTTVTRVETAHGRATGGASPPTASGSPADVVVLNPDLPVAYRDLLPGRARQRRLRYSPSCVVLHVGSRAGLLRRSPTTTSTSDGPGRAPSTR